MPELIGTDSRGTLAAWTTHLTVRFPDAFEKLTIQVVETAGVNAADWRVQASAQPATTYPPTFSDPHTLTDENGTSEFDLPADTSQVQTLCDCWNWIRVQARNNGGLAPAATLTINILGG